MQDAQFVGGDEARRALVIEYARADVRGSWTGRKDIERRFRDDPAALDELKRAAGRTWRRYNACLAEWVEAPGRKAVRRAQRATTRIRRVRAMQMAIFHAMGDALADGGLMRDHGRTVNAILRGDIEPTNSLRPALRFYRRLLGYCPGCGGAPDARESGSVCPECES